MHPVHLGGEAKEPFGKGEGLPWETFSWLESPVRDHGKERNTEDSLAELFD